MKNAALFAACCIAIAAPCLARAQPPASAQADGTDDQAAAQQPAPDTQDDQMRANPSQPPSADADSARVDESASVDGVPPWVFDTWCITQDVQPPQGWGISRDHSVGYRVNGQTTESRWSVVSTNARTIVLDVYMRGQTTRLSFNRPNDNDAGQDFMFAYGRQFEHCGVINFNERF